MTTSTANGLTTTYVYNVRGERIEKSNSSLTAYFVYDESGHLVGEYGAGGALVEETIWLGDTPVATIRPSGSSVASYYVHTDHLNTPRIVTLPSNNAVVWRWDVDAFGTVAPNSNPSGLGSFTYNLRFPGQYADAETGLSYNYFRDYDSQTGRYVESDPAGLSGGVNTYGYVSGSPIGRIDSLGLYDVVVSIWSASLAYHSVGHVAVADTDGTVLTSEFPYGGIPVSALTPLTWAQTIASEGGRSPDSIYLVHVPDSAQAGMRQVATIENNKAMWSFLPAHAISMTNCTAAAVATLGKGGIPGFPEWWWPILTPGRVNSVLSDLSHNSNSGVIPIGQVPWTSQH